MYKRRAWVWMAALLLALTLVIAGCAPQGTAPTAGPTGTASATPTAASKPTADRAGNAITVPASVETIVSLAPATTQVLYDLGLEDKIIAVDTYSPMYVDVDAALPQFNMMEPDIEQLIALNADIVFVSDMSLVEGVDPFQPIVDAGICVIHIPSSTSIEGIKEDVAFTAACVSADEKGAELLADMQEQIDEIAAIGATVQDKKTVLFEIGAMPAIYSFGSGTFLNEMIELIGAKNVLADQTSWLAVSEESAIAANPDVILTNVNYLDDPVAEILARPGWAEVTAVKDGAVYSIDNASSSLPNHHITKALLEMAKAVYPDLYE